MIDLYVKNGRSISGEPIEILIEYGEIKAVSKKFDNVTARKVLDLKQAAYVSAGWIDDHVHCYEKLALYSDQPDLDGVTAGVTTVIDAGSTGADNLADFYQLASKAKTNVYAMCNISKTGIIAQDELGDLNRIQPQLVSETLAQYQKQFVVGIKARMSKSVVAGNGIVPLERAKAIQRQNANIPLMVHIGTNPPELSEIMAMLDPGDIITHCYNGKPNGILDHEFGQIKQFAIEAYQRGIIFDVGHGTESFSFEVAQKAKEIGLAPQTISSDLYHRNRENGPVYNLATCLDKMYYLGYSLAELMPMVTSHPAANFKLMHKGQLAAGFDGDLTIFSIENQKKVLTDSNGYQVTTHRVFTPHYSVVGGTVYQTNMEVQHGEFV